MAFHRRKKSSMPAESIVPAREVEKAAVPLPEFQEPAEELEEGGDGEVVIGEDVKYPAPGRITGGRMLGVEGELVDVQVEPVEPVEIEQRGAKRMPEIPDYFEGSVPIGTGRVGKIGLAEIGQYTEALEQIARQKVELTAAMADLDTQEARIRREMGVRGIT